MEHESRTGSYVYDGITSYYACFGHERFDDMYAWCTKSFGPRHILDEKGKFLGINPRWHKTGLTFHFSKSEDYLAFLMVWQ